MSSTENTDKPVEEVPKTEVKADEPAQEVSKLDVQKHSFVSGIGVLVRDRRGRLYAASASSHRRRNNGRDPRLFYGEAYLHRNISPNASAHPHKWQLCLRGKDIG